MILQHTVEKHWNFYKTKLRICGLNWYLGTVEKKVYGNAEVALVFKRKQCDHINESKIFGDQHMLMTEELF